MQHDTIEKETPGKLETLLELAYSKVDYQHDDVMVDLMGYEPQTMKVDHGRRDVHTSSFSENYTIKAKSIFDARKTMMLRIRAFEKRVLGSFKISSPPRRVVSPRHHQQFIFPLSPSTTVSGRRYLLSEAVTRRLDSMVARHVEIMQKMEEFPEDSYKFGQELASLAQAVSLHEKKSSIEADDKLFSELLQECEDDEDMIKECQRTLELCKKDMENVEKRIRTTVLPRDENDFRSNAIVEIRAGTGGDEASLFASELREAYEKTAKARGFECEVLSESKSDLGGIKETVLSISARGFGGGITEDPEDDEDFKVMGPYGLLRYESGVHRVQRVPVNDTRIHTSACSVAVLPLFQDSKEEPFPMSELKIETMRSSGAGGQHVNTTDSAVRITHIPTGITASIQDERSQHKNKDKALKLIVARVRDKQQEEEERERGETRSSLLGGGDRSERIRTYNYPQDRVSDHRCKHTTHGISKLLEGSEDDGLVVAFFPFLRDMVREEQMNSLEAEEAKKKE